MTEPRLVFSAQSTRTQLPIGDTAVLWLLLDRLKPPGWIVGAAWTIWGLGCLLLIMSVVLEWRAESISAREIDDRLRKLERAPR